VTGLGLKETKDLVERVIEGKFEVLTSVVLNLAEGQRREKGNKRRSYEIAHGEARELLGCLDCARGLGWVVDDRAAAASLGTSTRARAELHCASLS